MFETLGDILAGGPQRASNRRTGQPVRRESNLAGRCEGAFWKPTSRQETRKILLAARRYELATRQPGARNGALGFVALEILELFANLVQFRTGRLDPALDYLMRTLKRSRDAIVRALKALRDHGFLDWLRRYVPTGAETGPRVKQTSNAYRLSLPARALRLLGRLMQTPPQPDDFSHQQQERAAERERHKAALPFADRALFDFTGDDALAASLRRLALGVERESARRSESRS